MLENWPIYGVAAAGMLGGGILGRLAEHLPARLLYAAEAEARQMLDSPLAADGAPPPRAMPPITWHALAWRRTIGDGGLGLLNGAAWAVAAAVATTTQEAALLAGLGTALVLLAAIDLRSYVLPDVVVLPLLWVGLLAAALGWGSRPIAEDAIIGAAAGYAVPWLAAGLYGTLRGREMLGGGDLKLLAALGAWGGWPALPEIAGLAAAAALTVIIPQRLLHYSEAGGSEAEEHPLLAAPLAFGPYLALAGWLVVVAGVRLPGGG